MRCISVLLAAMTLALGIGATALPQSNEDPTTSGTTGLFVVPRAATVEEGRFSIGAGFSQLAREELSTRIRTFGVFGSYGLTDRVEIFVRFDPYIEIQRKNVVAGTPIAVFYGANGILLNDHPYAHTLFVPGDSTNPLADMKFNGTGDTTMGVKWRFVGDSYTYDGVALAARAKFPTADDGSGIGTGRPDLGFNLIGSALAFGELGLNGYIGYTFKGQPEQAAFFGFPGVGIDSSVFTVSNEFNYGVGAQIPVSSVIQLILEGYGLATVEDVRGTDPSLGLFSGSTIGGDDYFVLQGGLRVTTESGLALNAAINRNFGVALRSADWIEKFFGNADKVDDELEQLGFLASVSYSNSRREPVTYRGSEPMMLPPVNRPPTLECRAERTTLRVGESVRLFATTSDPDNDPVTVSWSASAGTISPTTGNEVTWNSAGVSPGRGPISARATDGYGGTADCNLRLTVEAPPPPPEPRILNFSCGEFRSGSSRIDNRCKAILDDVALQLRQNPGATAVITGHSDSSGAQGTNDRLAIERGDNGKAYLVETHGIDGGRISAESRGTTQPIADNSTREGRAQNRRIEVVVTIPPR